MTTGKTIALSIQTSVGKVMSLLFNMLSMLVITLLPRSKHLLISWLQSLATVILEPRKIKSATVSTFSPSVCHHVMGLDGMVLVFWMLSSKPPFSLSFFTLIMGIPFLCRLTLCSRWSINPQIFFRSSCSLCRYILNVPVEGDEFRVFLYSHLSLPSDREYL